MSYVRYWFNLMAIYVFGAYAYACRDTWYNTLLSIWFGVIIALLALSLEINTKEKK